MRFMQMEESLSHMLQVEIISTKYYCKNYEQKTEKMHARLTICIGTFFKNKKIEKQPLFSNIKTCQKKERNRLKILTHMKVCVMKKRRKKKNLKKLCDTVLDSFKIEEKNEA